jgi:hypothetical protein
LRGLDGARQHAGGSAAYESFPSKVRSRGFFKALPYIS